MNSCMFTCIISHLIESQVRTIVEPLLSYAEFPCCLAGGHLDSVGAVVYIHTKYSLQYSFTNHIYT
jgi:hypothetical protein